MEIVNNYILVEKSRSDTIDNHFIVGENPNSISFRTPPHPIKLISKLFSIDENKWEKSEFLYFSRINTEFSFNTIIQPFTIEITTVGKIHYMSVSIEAKTKLIAIKSMEEFHKKIKNDKLSLQKYYELGTTYDSVSEYYINKIFPKVAQFERLFHRLLFDVFLLNYGRNYHLAINKELYDRIIKRNGKKKQSDISPELEFFHFPDLGVLKQILFEKEWLEVDSLAMNKFLDVNPDLSKLKDSDLRKFIEENQPRSRWERLFGTEDFPIIKQDFNSFTDYRNNVAHAGIFFKQDYENSKLLLVKLINYTKRVIIKTETIDFANKSNVELIESLRKLSSSIGSMFTDIIKLNYLSSFKSINDSFKNFDQTYFNYIEKILKLSELDTGKSGNDTDSPEVIQ